MGDGEEGGVSKESHGWPEGQDRGDEVWLNEEGVGRSGYVQQEAEALRVEETQGLGPRVGPVWLSLLPGPSSFCFTGAIMSGWG